MAARLVNEFAGHPWTAGPYVCEAAEGFLAAQYLRKWQFLHYPRFQILIRARFL